MYTSKKGLICICKLSLFAFASSRWPLAGSSFAWFAFAAGSQRVFFAAAAALPCIQSIPTGTRSNKMVVKSSLSRSTVAVPPGTYVKVELCVTHTNITIGFSCRLSLRSFACRRHDYTTRICSLLALGCWPARRMRKDHLIRGPHHSRGANAAAAICYKRLSFNFAHTQHSFTGSNGTQLCDLAGSDGHLWANVRLNIFR